MIEDIVDQLYEDEVIVINFNKAKEYRCRTNFQEKERQMILAGGKINFIKGE